jgi:hypothetical protein
MKDFFNHLQHNHKNAIKNIKDMIDVDGEEKQRYPEYKEAAILCNFIFTYPHRYSLIYHAEKYGAFYDCAQDLERLFNLIYHAIVDDGDISFIQVNRHCPAIVFEHRSELSLDNLLKDTERDSIKRLNEFKATRNLPPTEHTLDFFKNVWEYMDAVKAYDIQVEKNHKKWLEIKNRIKK